MQAQPKILKDLSGLATLLKAKIQHKHIPWYVDIVVTERCNLDCYYCYIKTAIKRSATQTCPRDLPLGEWKRIINELYGVGTRYITLLGGEPLLRDDIREIIRYIKTKRIHLDLYTNGILIDRRKEDIKDLDAIFVSIDGSRDVHEAERGKNSFLPAINNLDIIKTMGIPLGFNFTVTRNNFRELDFVVELAKQYKATVFIGEAIKNYPDEEIINESVLSEPQINEFWENINSHIMRGSPILKSKNSVAQLIASAGKIGHDDILMKDDSRVKEFGLFPCQFGRYSCQLSAEGVFYPCSKLYGRSGYNSFKYGVKGAFERMAEGTECICCRMCLMCNINGFLSLDPKSVLKSAGWYLKNMMS